MRILKPSVGRLPPRLGFGERDRVESERHRLAERDRSVEWRRWYKTARWQKLRLRVLVRDLFTCQATGVPLVGKYPAPNSAVVDHKVPHRGDPALFWDEDNLHAVSKGYHDSIKQSQESGEPRMAGGVG